MRARWAPHLDIWPCHETEKEVPEAATALQVDEDAFLKMQEDYLQMKRKQQEDHQKMRECAPSHHASPAVAHRARLS